MRTPLGKIAVCLAAGALGLACSKATDDAQVLQADLSGNNEVPARATAASGTAGFTIDGDTVHFSVIVQNFSSITQGHIHSGAAGVNGPVRVFLFDTRNGGTTFNPTGVVNGVLAEGSFTAADLVPGGVSYDQLISEMRAGTAYANFHTTLYPGGEIRGQTRLLN
jgi:CHRD domain